MNARTRDAMTRETSVVDAAFAFARSRRRGVRARACVVGRRRARSTRPRPGWRV